MGMLVNPNAFGAGGGGGPPTYLLYRLHMTSLTVAGQILALTEWEIFESLGGPNVAGSAVVTASSDGFGWLPSNMNNGDYFGTGWHAANNAIPQWVQYDFTAAGGKRCHTYGIFPRNGREDQAPGAFDLIGSNDGSSWATLDSQAGLDVVFWQTAPRPKMFVV